MGGRGGSESVVKIWVGRFVDRDKGVGWVPFFVGCFCVVPRTRWLAFTTSVDRARGT